MNCKQPTKEQLDVSVFEIVSNTISLDVSSVCRRKAKVWVAVASGTINMKNYKK